MEFKLTFKLCLFSVMLFFVTQTYAAQKTAILCDKTYALCTSAPCIPDPKDPSTAICECVVQKGKNAGFSTCEQRKPLADKYKATHILSTFSYAQFATKKSLSCPKGTPWSNCVDMPCTIDPQNQNRAICNCKIDNTHAFFTFGGNCKTASCSTGFWSAAVSGEITNSLRDAFNKTGDFIASSACPLAKQ